MVEEFNGYKAADCKLRSLFLRGILEEKEYYKLRKDFDEFNNEDGENTIFKFIIDEEKGKVKIQFAPPMAMSF